MKSVAKKYTAIKGVDFSSEESDVFSNRSPNMVNMYRDYAHAMGYAVETRPGLRILARLDVEIEESAPADSVGGGLFVSGGGEIWYINPQGEKFKLCDCENKARFLHFTKKTYMFAGDKIYSAERRNAITQTEREQVESGEFCLSVVAICPSESEEGLYDYIVCLDEGANAFVPTTYMTARNGEVSAFQPKNLICGKQKNLFHSDGENKTFILIPALPEEEISDVVCKIDGEETDGFTIFENTISLSEAADDLAEIEVEFSQISENPIAKCDVFYTYDERVFAGGNSNRYFWSGLSDPLYFPNASYECTPGEKVEAFFQVSGDLALTTRNQTMICTTVATGLESLPKTYPAKVISSTYGGKACCNFLLDPVVLTKDGLMGISNTDIGGEKNLFHRSSLVNGKMAIEKGYQNATLCVYKGYLFICFDGECYLANSRETFPSGENFEYEYFYWKNIELVHDYVVLPAKKLISCEDRLYMHCDKGYILTLNDDLVVSDVYREETGELRNIAYADDIVYMKAEPEIEKRVIYSCYATPFDDFGYRAYRKNTKKLGNVASFKSFVKSKCKIKTRSDLSGYREVGVYRCAYFDASEVDFSDFTFATSRKGMEFFRPQQKKFKQSQTLLYSDELYRPFGLLGLYQEVDVIGYAKR